MPPQNRVGCNDRRHLAQHLPPETLTAYRESASLLVGQSWPSSAQLRPQGSVLFDQILIDLALSVVQPVGESGKK